MLSRYASIVTLWLSALATGLRPKFAAIAGRNRLLRARVRGRASAASAQQRASMHVQVTSSPTRGSSVASAATLWAIFSKSRWARRHANAVPQIRSDILEFSAQPTRARASARKVRFLPPLRGGLHVLRTCAKICTVSTGLPLQGTTTRDSRPARFVALVIDLFRALPAMRTRLAFGFAGMCEMYEGASPFAACFAVGHTHCACLVWSGLIANRSSWRFMSWPVEPSLSGCR